MRAVVAAPVCPLMTAPGKTGELADQALFGMTVEVLERTAPGWWRVRTPYRYEGYAPAECLSQKAERWAALPKGVVFHKNAAPILAEPFYQAPCLLTVPLGAVLALAGEPREGWRQVTMPEGQVGYVRASWLEQDRTAPGELTQEALRGRLVDTALRYRYSPYRWGGKTPQGIDCSGLCFMAYWLNGIAVWRDAAIRPGFELVEIPKEQTAPGDLLFFPGHVAMYIGEGRYLHATGRAGSDGFALNSLEPEDPLYRQDLAEGLAQVGSYRGFHP